MAKICKFCKERKTNGAYFKSRPICGHCWQKRFVSKAEKKRDWLDTLIEKYQ